MYYDPQCSGKTCYRSKAKAIERIDWQKKDRRRYKHRNHGWAKGMILVPYRCRKCHYWHVGSTNERPTGGGAEQARKIYLPKL